MTSKEDAVYALGLILFTVACAVVVQVGVGSVAQQEDMPMVSRMDKQAEDSIELGDEPFELEIKRFYLPATLIAGCPRCGDKAKFEGDHEPLTYPMINDRQEVPFHCHQCDDWFTKYIVLQIDAVWADPEDPTDD